jgi:histidine triad (HIT) family protein
MQSPPRLARAQQAPFPPDGITLRQASGAAGGQTVGHFHLHVVARHAGDGVSFAWPRKEPGAEVIAGYAAQLREALG